MDVPCGLGSAATWSRGALDEARRLWQRAAADEEAGIAFDVVLLLADDGLYYQVMKEWRRIPDQLTLHLYSNFRFVTSASANNELTA